MAERIRSVYKLNLILGVNTEGYQVNFILV
jgi:hypothetical protein